MPIRPSRKNRDYGAEYRNYQGSSEQKKRRAKRNSANKKKKCKLGDDAHIDNNPNNNAPSNLKCQKKSKNRSFKRNKKGGHK